MEYFGTVSMFMHVALIGSLSSEVDETRTPIGGLILLNPSTGGREQPVMNLEVVVF